MTRTGLFNRTAHIVTKFTTKFTDNMTISSCVSHIRWV